MGGHWKIQFLGWWGGHEKTVYRDIAENGGLRQFAELRRGLAKKKRVWCFWGDWYPNAHYGCFVMPQEML